ncbi:MAG: guanylate kinase [Thermodesulfovibrionales bacterium]|nr:guanylate kinase [Thermodesulfovibrionales bacterium]
MKYKNNRGCLFVLSAPSGTGKTTIANRICKELDNIEISISYTTRQPRDGEVEGLHYYFIQKDRFNQMINDNAFLEWAAVHGNYYGTSRYKIEEILSSNKDVLLDIDTQGGKSIKLQDPDSVLIFIMPPSFDELKNRLIKRATEPIEKINQRLQNAHKEISESIHYDYIVVNDDLDRAVEEVKCIIKAERNRTIRYNIKHMFKSKEG